MSEKKPTIKELSRPLGKSVAMDGSILKTPPKPAVNRTPAGATTPKVNQPTKGK